jgi:hypothetical protein
MKPLHFSRKRMRDVADMMLIESHQDWLAWAAARSIDLGGSSGLCASGLPSVKKEA